MLRLTPSGLNAKADALWLNAKADAFRLNAKADALRLNAKADALLASTVGSFEMTNVMPDASVYSENVISN